MGKTIFECLDARVPIQYIKIIENYIKSASTQSAETTAYLWIFLDITFL